ncbi:hypothetical protein EYF80_048983 [Liparis tanakae]|uniref:Uncharacterized protein n=1 Tax=Liparis tanakae TaxID=230148 RepID=A0A4Z2FI67_9TELE|nr:hypothetical protein EYF80_048983 [Liparis tanakae]
MKSNYNGQAADLKEGVCGSNYTEITHRHLKGNPAHFKIGLLVAAGVLAGSRVGPRVALTLGTSLSLLQLTLDKSEL